MQSVERKIGRKHAHGIDENDLFKKQKAKISLSLLFEIKIMHSKIVDDHRDIIEDTDRERIFDLDKKKTRMSSCCKEWEYRIEDRCKEKDDDECKCRIGLKPIESA